MAVKWSYLASRKSRSDACIPAPSLEDEISSLRRKMEDAFLECESLTSDLVVDLSRKLDVKINEYMRAKHKME